MKLVREQLVVLDKGCRRPRGRRGLKHHRVNRCVVAGWSPPARAAWIETVRRRDQHQRYLTSPPARAAWIETRLAATMGHSFPSPPARAAWIETSATGCRRFRASVSPPARAAWIETTVPRRFRNTPGSPPARAAWIETHTWRLPQRGECRRPRGRRGLKRTWANWPCWRASRRRPRGRRGLKHVGPLARRRRWRAPPARAAWIETIAALRAASSVAVAARAGGVD